MCKLLGAIALAITLLGSAQIIPASASIGHCSGDPVITLHPGLLKLDIQTSIADSASNVSGATYTVLVPGNITGWSVQTSGDFPETVVVHNTNQRGQYDAYTYATDANTVALNSVMTLTNASGAHQFGQGQASGTTNETVHTDGGGWFPPSPL
jgi:hypothetical protein